MTPQELAQDSYANWKDFLERALKNRLDQAKFAVFAPIHSERYPLTPLPIADLFLRPTCGGRYSLDTRVPFYLQTLLDLRLVDLQAVLAGLLRYTSVHAIVGGAISGVDAKEGDGTLPSSAQGDKGEGKPKEIERWENSYTFDEVIFYRLRKAVANGSAIRHGKDAVEVCLMMAKWMTLFTAASAALPVQHNEDVMMGGIGTAYSANKKTRDQLDNVMAAFVMLLLGIVENPVVLQALSQPYTKSKSC